MALITFQDLPDTSTALNSNNLNNNFNYLKNKSEGIVLYNNTSGTNGNVTLSDNITNYEYIEIYYKRTASTSGNNLGYSSTKFPVVSSSMVITTSFAGNTGIFIYSTSYIASGTNLTINTNAILRYNTSTSSFEFDNTTNGIFITQIIGYK